MATRRVEEFVEGELIDTPYGPCFVVETRYALDEVRARWRYRDWLTLPPDAPAHLARDLALRDFSLAGTVFVDTETTGLSGGTGTYAFLVGVGTFEPAPDAPQPSSIPVAAPQEPSTASSEQPATSNEPRVTSNQQPVTDFVIRQFFMRHPGEERALLYALSRVLDRCTSVVSFNGRSFDLPLLNTRFLMFHELPRLHDAPHLDLLHPARRIWRPRLSSCALSSLETEVLGLRRATVDVPGWLIPRLYLDYVRTGDPGEMVSVFYHNLEDIRSLVPLAVTLGRLFDRERAGPEVAAEAGLHPMDYVSLARDYELLGWLEAGEATYREALKHALPPDLQRVVISRLSFLLKRQERRAEAAELWQDWITSVPGDDVTPYVELAKYYEWHEVNLEAAQMWTRWALHIAERLPSSLRRDTLLAELRHRLRRLERKTWNAYGRR